MKKTVLLSLLLSLLVLLCACGTGMRDAAEAETEEEYYWRVETKSCYPLGLSGHISGVAADGERIFLCGNRDEQPRIVRLGYAIEDGKCTLSAPEPLVLPTLPEGSRAVSMTYGAGQFYLLLGVAGAEESKSYLVAAFTPDGALSATLPVSLDGGDEAKTLTVLEDGSFWLRGLHQLRHYSADGAALGSVSEGRRDFCPAVLIDGEAVFHTFDYESCKSELNRFNAQTGELVTIEAECALPAPTALCQSAIGTPLIHADGKLLALDSDGTATQIADWAELLEPWTQYRHVCQLDEDIFLLVPANINETVYKMERSDPGDAGELICLKKTYVPDERKLVRVALYGLASEMTGMLERQFNHYSPDYKVECLAYGMDESGLTRLMQDAATSDRIDIVLSDGYSIDPSKGFIDLYPLIDGDAELSREAFVPQVLAGIEQNGELHEIWSGFSIWALYAMGPLSEEPTPLRLTDCGDYLDSTGYTEPMFGNYYTKMVLLHALAPGMLKEAYNAESASYDLGSGNMRALLTLCAGRPAENDSESEYTDEVLVHTDLQPDHLNYLLTSGLAFRLFDGSDGGDNFTNLICDYRGGYLIPKTCPDKENAWGFLRIMLTEEWQLKEFDRRRICYPSNAAALETVLDSYPSSAMREEVYRLTDSAALRTLDYAKAEKIFIESVQPYLYGDRDLDTVLNIAQGKINIFTAERAE